MGFNAQTGVYTNTGGSENAVPAQVIRSATWNSINVAYAAALTAVAQQAARPQRTISGAGNATIAVTDGLVFITASVPNLVLPASASKLGAVVIMGAASGMFNTNACTITCNGAETINGAATRTLTTAYQAVTLVPGQAGWNAY